MKRFFRKDPPPGWTPPNPNASPPLRGSSAFVDVQKNLQLATEAANTRRATHSAAWSATPPSDSIPWTAASVRHEDGHITLRDHNGNVVELPPDPRLVERHER